MPQRVRGSGCYVRKPIRAIVGKMFLEKIFFLQKKYFLAEENFINLYIYSMIIAVDDVSFAIGITLKNVIRLRSTVQAVIKTGIGSNY